jgi:hypothetical protein
MTSMPNDVTPKKLVGTKWIAAETNSDNKGSIEIIDEKYCICKSMKKVTLRTYEIMEGQIFISGFISYTIRDNIFFQDGTPLYSKE